MDLIEEHTFRELSPRIVAVADANEDAPGILRAKEKGLFTTKDYNDFFVRDDIDLIMELSRNYDIYHDILLKKKKTVRAIDHRTSNLFWEISFVRRIQERTEQKLEEINTNLTAFGLEIKLNPSNDHWFLSFKDNIEDLPTIPKNRLLSTKLSATLFSILILSISEGGRVSISEIRKIRNKKDISQDLEELKDLGFILINGNLINLTSKLFYYIDIDEISSEINKMNSNSPNS